MNSLQNIHCPNCGKKNTWNNENKFRPFCSDRCKLIDLGEWAKETRKIPGETVELNHSADMNGEEKHLNDDV
ncbi:MAG: DNA gyrase inhibitor YacG [bacterium]|nr:DNA gyrase inhibitor YacG [bacterium]